MIQIYLSGPMTGLPENNFPAFEEATNFLRSHGWSVVSPHEVVKSPDSTWEDYLRADLLLLIRHCNVLATLPGWEKSKGAQLEVNTALALKFPLVHFSEIQKNPDLDSWTRRMRGRLSKTIQPVVAPAFKFCSAEPFSNQIPDDDRRLKERYLVFLSSELSRLSSSLYESNLGTPNRELTEVK